MIKYYTTVCARIGVVKSLDKSAGAGDSNPRPEEVQSNALPTRLSGLVANYACGNISRQAIFVSVPTERKAKTKHFRIRSYGTQSKGTLTRRFSSVVEHSTTDQEVPSSDLGAPSQRK
ncbi:hypothetical protein TNCV_3675081 [Trichonephila clavipes]|nr:hypothetical protein TNCV_3675081 [Trichonephila clavipes]